MDGFKHVVKRFTGKGIRRVEDILLFVWRDLLIALIEARRFGGKSTTIIDMLNEIAEVWHWVAIPGLLFGGERARRRCIHDSDDDDDGPSVQADSEEEADNAQAAHEDDFEAIDQMGLSIIFLRCHHWHDSIRKCGPILLNNASEALLGNFRMNPSLNLWGSIMQLHPGHQVDHLLDEILKGLATSSSETFAVSYVCHGVDSAYSHVRRLWKYSLNGEILARSRPCSILICTFYVPKTTRRISVL